MATKAHSSYTKQEQQDILAEADAAVVKTLAAVAKKYPGVTLSHNLGITVPSEPLTVSHSGTTRPLTAADTH